MTTCSPAGVTRTALSTRFASTRSRSAASARTAGNVSERRTSTFAARATEARERGGHDLFECDRFEGWGEHPGVDPAHAEQVLDEACQSIGLVVDRGEEFCFVAIRPVDVGLAQARDRRLDRRERRAQIVGDRLEEGAAQVVRLRERLRAVGLAAQPCVLEHDAELRGEGLQHGLVLCRDRATPRARARCRA